MISAKNLDSKSEITSINTNALTSMLICPITQQIFFDPVASFPCGHVFEREAITEWRATKNECPCCRKSITGLCESPIINDFVELAVTANPQLQNDRYFKMKILETALHENNKIKLDKLIKILKSSDYLNAISEEKGFIGESAITELTARPMGRLALSNDETLREHINEKGLNAVLLQEGPWRGTSALYWLAAKPEGRALFTKDEKLVAKITAEGLNSIRQEGLNRGTSALYWLAGSREGWTLLSKDEKLVAKITAEGLNSILKDDGCDQGTSALYWLTANPEGRKLLLKKNHLVNLINIDTLMTVIPDGPNKGTSAYQCLRETEEGKENLKNNPMLQLKIDRWKGNPNQLFANQNLSVSDSKSQSQLNLKNKNNK